MKILFVHQWLWPYVERDLRILSESHKVRECYFRNLLDIGRLFLGVLWCDVTYSWFGSLHAFFAVAFSRFLGRQSIVVAGGWDVGQPPDGLVYQSMKQWCPQYVFTKADLVLTVSDFNHKETLTNIQGKINHIQRIYHGFDTQHFQPMPGVFKENIVLTVGAVNIHNVPRKGLDLFVSAARYIPDTRFYLIGQWLDDAIDTLKSMATPNVLFLGEVSDEELIKWYSRAKVYVQASKHEAFGCSVAEAMLCGCIPVVTRCAALPEVVGKCGFYADMRESKILAEKIKEAIDAPAEMGRKVRPRIIEYYPLEKRGKEVLSAVRSLECQ